MMRDTSRHCMMLPTLAVMGAHLQQLLLYRNDSMSQARAAEPGTERRAFNVSCARDWNRRAVQQMRHIAAYQAVMS